MATRRLLILSTTQRAELWDGPKLLKSYVVSTAKNGLGCSEGSFCTPNGKLRVAQKIGEHLALGTLIKARVPSDEIWSKQAIETQDLVLTRLLWLEGADDHNRNTLNRYIYLHGTNHEDLLGLAHSHGCVRFSNEDIVEVFNLLDVGCEVEIV